MSYTLGKIAKIVQGKCLGDQNIVVEQLLIDSRTVNYGPSSLFFAIRGERNDGHNYVEGLIKNKVIHFVVSNPSLPEQFKEANFIVVNDTLDALQKLAAFHRAQFKIPVIAITGSNGKTIVKEWLSQAIGEDKRVVKNPKSYNSQVGVPLSVWQLNSNAELGIFEAGISKPGEMERLEKIIRPSIGVLTNLGDAHQENFSNHMHKAREKLNLFKNVGTIIYSRDQELVHTLISNDPVLKNKRLFTWASKDEGDLRLKSTRFGKEYVEMEAFYKEAPITIQVPFFDDASIENAIQVWSTLLYLGYSNDVIQKRILQLSPVAMRMEQKKGIRKCTLINDSYNSDIVSLRTAIDFLLRQDQNTKKTIILSDIQQSGKETFNLYSEVAALTNHERIDNVIGIGPDLCSSKGLFKNPGPFYLTTDDFLASISQHSFEDEAILLKGARTFQFERIAEKLEETVHHTVLEINFNALIHNLNYFKSKLNSGTKIMVMVKAFSYGSGTFEIANLLNYHRVDYLGVAFADEGVALRRSGVQVPILVMGPNEDSIDKIIEYNLEPEVFNLDILEQVRKAVEKSDISRYPVHLKIDTGMHRLGFMEQDIDRLISSLAKMKNLIVKSIFSHLAASDETIYDPFTLQQIKKFVSISAKLKTALGYDFIKHILNSSGIERFPQYQMDMVRLGIGLYGVSAMDNTFLKPISTLKSSIIQVKYLRKDETVGYGRKGKLLRDSKIAIIPVGYADGINRKLGNGNWEVIINGHKVPIIGNICMDLCMVDVTDIDAKEKDEVIIFGEVNTITELAKKLGTIPYEILTGISERVKRIYFHE